MIVLGAGGPPLVLRSTLTCPACGFAEELSMPTNACTFFHECANCRVLLRPNAGDCCVFCSFGSVPCPPIQAGDKDCCARGDPNPKPTTEQLQG